MGYLFEDKIVVDYFILNCFCEFISNCTIVIEMFVVDRFLDSSIIGTGTRELGPFYPQMFYTRDASSPIFQIHLLKNNSSKAV